MLKLTFNILNMSTTDPNILAAQETPGKADDFLAVAECITTALADAFRKARIQFVSTDGELALKGFSDYTAFINFVYREVYIDVANCLGGAVTPKIKNQIINAILQLIGIDLSVETSK